MIHTGRELLLAVADAFEQRPETWTQGSNARDARGNPVVPVSVEARCWCFLGKAVHLLRANEDSDNMPLCQEVVELASKSLGTNSLLWHDAPGRTVAEVVQMLRKAAG